MSPAVARAGQDVERRERRRRDTLEEARTYGHRQALRATTARPSIVGRAGAGAVAGGAAGAAIGGPVTAAGGAILGGAGGAVGGARAKRAYRMAMRTNGRARQVVVAEFAVCVIIAALSPLTDAKRDEPAGAWMKRMTAIMGVFLILGLVSAGGRGAARVAAGLGALITVALAVSERDLFTKIASIFSTPATQTSVGVGGVDHSGEMLPAG
jgi:hypothetical protein